MSKTIVTGLKSNAALHLGNYLGGILPMAESLNQLSQNDQFYIFVADLHSFTTPVDHNNLYDLTLFNVKAYLAAGLKPSNNVHLFRQSHVSAHSELAWILSCFSSYGEIQGMIQFKEKSVLQGQSVSVGLFTYPILMAADILLYGAEYVPLGDDQQQHLEITRDIAIRVNNKFSDKYPEGLFVLPKKWSDQLEFMKKTEGLRIRSLSNPDKKMSKSISDPKGTINLTDKPSEAAKKVMSATTDSVGVINWDWVNQPGITNLLQLYAILSKISIQETKQKWVGQTQYGDLKKQVANLIEQFLADLQSKLNQYSDTEIEDILSVGENQANAKSQETLARVQKAIGIKN